MYPLFSFSLRKQCSVENSFTLYFTTNLECLLVVRVKRLIVILSTLHSFINHKPHNCSRSAASFPYISPFFFYSPWVVLSTIWFDIISWFMIVSQVMKYHVPSDIESYSSRARCSVLCMAMPVTVVTGGLNEDMLLQQQCRSLTVCKYNILVR